MFKFFGRKIRSLFQGKIDEKTLEELEQLFFEADLGTKTSEELTEKVRTLYRKNSKITSEEILREIKKALREELETHAPSSSTTGTPHIILIVGVNGNGKTTTVAKLATHFQKQGKSVLIAAADTFRAAATEQLQIWANKVGCALVKGKQGSDPAAVVFDAVEAAKSRGIDLVIVDTAGRLHTKNDLMKELEKIYRVTGKALPGAPHETLLILDATIGQNGIEQASTFHAFAPLTGIVLTKLDGTAKGGTALAIQKKLNLPIKYIGTGETLADLHLFQPQKFVDSLFE